MATASPSHGTPQARGSGLRVSAWNLLLIVPLLMLVTSFFNSDQPRLLGLPFFYWYQLLYVPVGVICVGIVYIKTRHLDNGNALRKGQRGAGRPDSAGEQR